jgi:hypothetical protein
MSLVRLAFSLFIVLMLGACSGAAFVPTQGSKTVQTQSVGTTPPLASTATPTVEATMVLSPVPPFATITFQADSCTYKGPQSVPAGETLIVNWRFKTAGVLDVYGLLPFATDEQKSREELIQAQQGLDIHRPALPDEFTSAGMVIGYNVSNLKVMVNTAGGPLHGPLHGQLYFGCWAAGQAYDTLGPVEIK